MLTLLLTRHGETIDNQRQIMQGQTPGQLNARGREQAAEVARRYAGTHIDAFVASDLRRAIQTAEIIARPHHLPVITTPLLRERDWGSFTGRFIPDLRNEPWPDDIENSEALLRRASEFLEFVKSRWQGQVVMAVGHGIINKAIQAVFYGRDMRDIPRMENAEVRRLDID